MNGRLRLLIAPVAMLMCLAGTAAQAEGAREIARHGAWTVLVADTDGQKTCFAANKPKQTVPATAKRDQAFVYVSAWPKDGVKAEVSVTRGAKFKRGSSVMLIVGDGRFPLFTTQDRAFVANPTAVLKLIDAMKKGSSMVVESIDESGSLVADVYSLTGLTQTMTAITQGCG